MAVKQAHLHIDHPAVSSRLPTPRTLRPGVKAMIRSDDAILLVKEARTSGETFWTLPGGGVRSDETRHQALRREIDEELGREISIDAPVGRCLYQHRSEPGVASIYSVYAGTIDAPPVPNRRDGILDVRWARPDALPMRTLRAFRDVIRDDHRAIDGLPATGGPV